MKRSYWFLAVPTVALGLPALGAVACSSDSDSDGNGGSGGSTGGDSCKPLAAECYVGGPDGPGNECLAKRDNTGQSKIQLRVSQLETKSPNALTQPFMQDQIVTKKITLNQDTCFQFGDAQYNWLFEIDEAAGTAVTGGGIPQALIGPAENGTCFANFMDPSGIPVESTTASSFTQTGNDVEAMFERFAIPIYIDNSENNYALLPINKLKINMTLSDDRNCVGRYAPERLSVDNTCKAGEGEFSWDNGASFEGYITVEEADSVQITSLGFTLCVLLSQDTNKWKGPADPRFDPNQIGSCATSPAGMAGELPEGNWCSATNDDSCADKDAWNLTGNFAASAIEITGDCT